MAGPIPTGGGGGGTGTPLDEQDAAYFEKIIRERYGERGLRIYEGIYKDNQAKYGHLPEYPFKVFEVTLWALQAVPAAVGDVGGVINQGGQALGDAISGTGSAVAGGLTASPLSGVAEVGAVLRAFFTGLTDWRMWASLGWLLLGLLLLIAGVLLWARPSLSPLRA